MSVQIFFIQYAYDRQRNCRLTTSYDAATGGNIVNQVLRVYNGLGQLSDLSRSTVTANPRWAEEWEEIRQYTQQEAEHALLKVREA